MVNGSKNVGDLVSKKTEFGEVRQHNFRLKPIARVLGTCALGLGFGLAHSVTQAATITVNNNGDSGVGCTLRDAIDSIQNQFLEADCTQTGSFGVNDTVIFVSAMNIALKTGSLRISTSDITIDASTVSGVTINGGNNSSVITISSFDDVPPTLTIDNLTITGGSAFIGGGIYVGSDSSLIANNSVITLNTAYGGGGVGGENDSNLSFSNTTVSNNTSTATNIGGYGGGGGIRGKGEVTLFGSDVTNNTALGNGGGIHLDEASLSMYGATISSNTASNGGGLSVTDSFASAKYNPKYNVGPSVISNNVASSNGGGVYVSASEYERSFFVPLNGSGSTDTISVLSVSNNTADENGGGIFIGGEIDGEIGGETALVTLGTAASNISGNSAGLLGGGIYLAENSGQEGIPNIFKYSTIDSNQSGSRGGGFYQASNTVFNINNSTISNNTAGTEGDPQTAQDKEGGGGALSGGLLTVVNSTVSGNFSSGYSGAGLSNVGGLIGLYNSTVSNNTLTSSPGSFLPAAGVANYGGGSMTINNSIVANSIGGVDCYGASTVDAFSIIEEGYCSATRTGDPGLQGLRDNGGPTKTHLPRENSIAINTGDNENCFSSVNIFSGGQGDELFDQRGESRLATLADVCDVGSVEFKDSDIEITSFYVIPLPNGGTVVIPL